MTKKQLGVHEVGAVLGEVRLVVGDTMAYKRGDCVMAVRRLDQEGAHVIPGSQGVVFEEAVRYLDKNHPDEGPLVRWCDGTVCNVYAGDTALFT